MTPSSRELNDALASIQAHARAGWQRADKAEAERDNLTRELYVARATIGDLQQRLAQADALIGGLNRQLEDERKLSAKF